MFSFREKIFFVAAGALVVASVLALVALAIGNFWVFVLTQIQGA